MCCLRPTSCPMLLLVSLLSLLLVPVSCARPEEGSANEKLLRHAVRNYDAWRRVWDQKVRPTGSLRPPYRYDADAAEAADDDDNGRRPVLSAYARDALRLPAHDDGGHVEPFAVARLVLYRYAWLGSYAEHAARLLSAAVSCLTAQYAWLQTELLVLAASKMTGAAHEPPTAAARLTETFAAVRGALLSYADKLAAVRGDMKPTADASFRLDRLIAEKPADCAPVLALLRDEADRSVDGRCARATAAELYGHFDDPHRYAVLSGDETTWADVADAVRTVAEGSAHMFDGLGHETISVTNWRQIFDYEYAIGSGVNVDAADPLTGGTVSP